MKKSWSSRRKEVNSRSVKFNVYFWKITRWILKAIAGGTSLNVYVYKNSLHIFGSHSHNVLNDCHQFYYFLFKLTPNYNSINIQWNVRPQLFYRNVFNFLRGVRKEYEMSCVDSRHKKLRNKTIGLTRERIVLNAPFCILHLSEATTHSHTSRHHTLIGKLSLI